ncbi:unnamed protein product [Notodromas monacha]|uniref:Fibronectin type-III domain-containing protein n=1 Tax=Notodromas monacha TaxID=399045 RepID=A0A7R9BYT9_9CRUS|nr:unnamed protein product [Notodromas monacha]CAG0922955.1 unnamed protein product [Notodromas monacha]
MTKVGEGEWGPDADDDETSLGLVTTNSTGVEVTGLKPFTLYTFRVAAVNGLGPSRPSLASYALATMREDLT